MIRSRALKRIKRKTPSGKMVIHLKKHSKKSLFRAHPQIKREKLKAKVRK
jgi:ribosomal protein L34E